MKYWMFALVEVKTIPSRILIFTSFFLQSWWHVYFQSLTGSAGSIHLDCLETWLKMTNRTRCEICSQPYQIVRQPLYGILSSIPAFINENTSYKWGCGYLVVAAAFFVFIMSYIVEHEFASWDYALFFCTIIIFFVLSAFVTAVKEWSSWRREQYKLTPRYRSKK